MNIFDAIILGTIEGLSEFLPISSTGHLILASNLLQIEQTEFVKTFEIAIQSGAILAVVFLYWRTNLARRGLARLVMTAFIPTAVIGLILYDFVKNYLLESTTVTLWSLGLGGLALILIELYFKRNKTRNKEGMDITDITSISYKNALLIGLVQSISIVPGVSRSAASIIGGMLFGMDRKTAVEFSFLLAIPTLMAATGLDLVRTNFKFNSNEWMLLGIGFITSFIVAVLVMKWFVSYVRRYTFIPFGIYRIVIALFLAGLFFLK